jgi:Flp pilus assembly protein TadD
MFSLYSADRLTDAESAGRKFLELNPNAAYAHCNLGVVWLAQHRGEAALATMSTPEGLETRPARRVTRSQPNQPRSAECI